MKFQGSLIGHRVDVEIKAWSGFIQKYRKAMDRFNIEEDRQACREYIIKNRAVLDRIVTNSRGAIKANFDKLLKELNTHITEV